MKIDRITGKYPTPTTPREKIFFEAFKMNDSIDNNSGKILDDEEEEDKNSSSEENSPAGIY